MENKELELRKKERINLNVLEKYTGRFFEDKNSGSIKRFIDYYDENSKTLFYYTLFILNHGIYNINYKLNYSGLPSFSIDTFLDDIDKNFKEIDIGTFCDCLESLPRSIKYLKSRIKLARKKRLI